MKEENANMAARYEREIPEGYEARIEGNKVIIELKESEDERIRKWLIEMVKELRKANPTNAEHNGNCSEAIAYLEKQKEQKPAKEDEIDYDLGRERGMDAGIEFVLNHLELYGLCKSAEWSEEDEEILKDIIYRVNGFDAIVGAIPQNFEQHEKKIKWLKSLPERFNLQPKQEWSEEEMKVLDSIIDDYEKAAKSFCGYEGKIMFLKAIRDGEYGLSKQEWNEKDEKHKQAIIDAIQIVMEECGDSESIEKYEEDINWFELFYNKLKNS